MRFHQFLILSTSLIVWFWAVKLYALLFLLLATLTLILGYCLERQRRKVYVATEVLVLLMTFVLLKSYAFEGWTLPLGYSMFAFSAISFTIDQYQAPKHYSPLEIFCYLFFFPKAFSGPLERTNDFISQLRNFRGISNADVYVAFKIFVLAAFCKFTLSDPLYRFGDSSLQGVNAFGSVGTYALAFYFDFYAYSLFAISLGRLWGVRLSNSFNAPYASKNLKDFWSRWNITLSHWLRDYVYIPMGGSRRGKLWMAWSIFVVFVVSALWHGASILFLLWGGLHALFLVLEKHFGVRSTLGYRLWVITLTFSLWQLFRWETLNDFLLFVQQCYQSAPLDIRLWSALTIAIITTIVIDNAAFQRLIFGYSSSRRTIILEVSTLTLILTWTLLFPHSISINFFYLRF